MVPNKALPNRCLFGYYTHVINWINFFVKFVFLLQHNFTDGMALGSAFLLYGSVGGWSRTLFLLAHELPQEVFSLSNIQIDK